MTKFQVMPWIDLLPGVEGSNFQHRRDAIQDLARQAAELTHKAQALTRQAQDLRARANLAACSLEGDAKGMFTIDAVEKAKTKAYADR